MVKCSCKGVALISLVIKILFFFSLIPKRENRNISFNHSSNDSPMFEIDIVSKHENSSLLKTARLRFR